MAASSRDLLTAASPPNRFWAWVRVGVRVRVRVRLKVKVKG